MKIKTFILTFLMMMSSPFLFGQQHWVPDELYHSGTMQFTSQIYLNGELQTNTDYEVAAFHGNELLAVSKILVIGEAPNQLFHVDLNVKGKDDFGKIYFKLFDGSKEYVSEEEIQFVNQSENGGNHITPTEINFKSVAQIEGAEYEVVYPTIEKAIAAAQEGETVTILEGNYTQNLDINKAITVQGERNDQGENLVNITGKLNITANNATAKNLNVNNGNGNGAYINAKNVTVDGCTVVGVNGFRNCYTTGLVTFMNSTITGSTYGIHFDGSAGGVIEIDNCVITGWTSFARTITKVTMKGTSFKEGNYNYVRFYQDEVVIEDCIFNENMAIDIAIEGNNTTIDGCTFTNGNIEDLFYGEDIVNSTIIVNGTTLKREASIGNTYYETLAEAYTAATDGQTITLLADITLSEIFVIEKSITFDGNGNKLTSTAGRAINVSGADGVTIKDLTINASGERAINVIQNATNVTIYNVTATAANYTVNLAGSAANAVVAVKNSNLTGLNVVNVAAAGAQVTVDKTVLNCADNSDDEKYAALALNKDAQGGSIIATEVTFNIAGDSRKATNQAENGTVTIDGSTEGVEVQVAYISYGDTWYGFATIEAAIAKANDGETIEIIRDITSADKITVTKSITINGNGKTLTYTGNGAAARAIDVPSTDGVKLEVTIKNLTVDCTSSYCQRGINYNEDGKLTLEGVTVKGTNVTYALNLPGSSDNCEVAINNSSLTGNIALNVWGENCTINAENTTFTAVDNNTVEGYATVKLNNDGTTSAEGTVINITGGMIDVTGSAAEDTEAASNGTSTGEINISESTVVNGRIATLVAVIRYADGNSYSFETLPAAIEFAKAGETVALLRDITASDIITIDKAITLDGNGKKLTSTAGRAINVDCEGNVGIKNLTINASGERAINVIQKPANVTIDNVTATAANYTVNLASSAGAAKVAISNSTLNGLCTVNVAAAGSQVTVDYSTVNCNDNNTTAGESYAALCLNKEAVGGSIVATNTTVNVTDGSDSMKGRNGAENGTVTINGSTEGVAVMVAAITYEDSDYYYSFATLEAAVEFAKTGDVITLIRDITASNIITINKAITLDLNGKKVTSTAQKAFEVYAAATIKNGTIEAAQRCVDTRKAVELTLTGVTLIADEYTTHGNPQPLTIGGSENGTKVVMTNVNISAVDGYGIITFVKTELTATESAISGYSALYVKPGSDNSEFNFVNSDLSGGNIGNDVEGNSFSTIAVRANNVAVNVDAESTVTANGDHYYAISFIGTSENTTTGSSVTVAGEITGNILDAPNGNTVKVKAEYADELAAAGYATIEAENGLVAVIKAVAKIKETGAIYGTLQAAVNAAQPGNTIVLLADITEDVTVNKSLTIDGENNTYTGQMKMTNDANITVKNVNFDGKGYDGYAVETRGANYLTVEDCTAKNYGYGFIQLASATDRTTVKNVTVSNMNYGVKVDYSNTVVLENLNLDCAVAAVLNSNYGEKTITIKNSNLSILGTWTRNNTIKTTYVFEGANTVDQFIIDAAIDNFKLAGVNSTLAAPNEITVTTDMEGYDVEYNEGVYSVVAGNVLNSTTGKKYATLQEAIDEANVNNVIVLLKDITENVTISKNLTIDGDDFNYTGNISVDNSVNSNVVATIKNVNFVNGTGYAIKTDRIKSITVENCTVNNYSFLYANKSTLTVVVKNVEVKNGNYGFHWSNGTTATLENVEMTDVTYGLYIQNNASKTINLKNCNITNIAIWEKASANQTFNFEGTNTVGTLSSSQYAKYVLVAADATLTAPEGSTVSTSVDGYDVKYEGGVYKVVANNVKIERTGATFATIQEAIDAAQTGDKVVLLENIELTEADCVVGADRKVLVDVANKDITLDMNGKKISVTHMDEFTNDYIVAVIRVGDGAGLTVTGNGIIDVKTLDNNPDIAYMFWKRGTTGHLTILNGTFHMNDAADSMVYTNGNEIVFIEGGNWTLDAYGTRGNREPWIFNVQGAGDNHVLVTGGTFNADINRQHWSNEVIVPETHYTEVNTENIDDEEITTYTVKKDAEAYVNTGMLTGPYYYRKNIGYATLAEAVKAAVDFKDSPVGLNEDVTLEETVIINGNGDEMELVIDLNEHTITGTATAEPTAFRIQNNANVIVKNGNINTENYNFILGASDATSVGNLTIESGKFHGTTSVVSVTKGHLNITGGEFSVEPYQGNYAYLINCIDANYNNETATVAISGGTFHNWNPQNNAAEGPGTSFCAPGYGAISNGNGTWTVVEAKDVALVRNNEIIEQFASIQAAIDKAQDGDVIKVLEDITLGYEDAEQMCDDNYRSFINVDGKTVTIDLNGCMVKAELGEELEVNYVYGMVTTENEANLTIEDNSEEKTGTMWIDNAVDVYSLVMQYDGSIITINSGNYKLNVGGNGRGMIYSNDDEKVTVNGGNLWLGNVGTKDNGSPWIFNASGTGGKQIIVTGGTYNADINRQHWSDEVFVPETHYTANIGEGTYTIKEGAEAYVNTGMLTGPYYYRKNIGYATLEEAVAAAVDFKDSPVKLLKDVELTETIVINGNGQDLTIDFNEKQVTSSASPAFRIQKDANVIVMNGNMNTENYNFILGASDATSAGNLTIESGNYKGASSVVSVTNGLLTINGGEFEANESEWGSQYLINCIDRYNINGSGIALVSITGGKFHGFNPEDNTAENPQVNFCAPGYGAVETAAGSNIWEVMPVQEQYLGHGFNWYSSYLDITTNDLLSALGESGKTVVLNGSWSATYFEGFGWDYNPHELDFSKMYMIETKQEHTLKLTGKLLNAGNIDIKIEKGWNWIGYPSNEKVEINTALKNLQATEGDRIVGQGGFADYAPIYGGWVGSLKHLEPTKGYQYNSKNVSEDGVKFNYNIAPATTRGNNETVVATHYSVDYTKYPFNMTMVAVVDGAMDDNYEVAALVNGEVRGSARPVYIDVLDAYMLFLTISGDNVEEVSFKYYDLTTGEEYDLVNRIDYSNNAMVGSVNEPYVLSRGTTGIGDAAMSQVNIYPNPTTTGTEINLEAVCDTVEVFNALGVKVAEYQNVDSIDALETAGIYVIRITNDGNVQNCRLVVK